MERRSTRKKKDKEVYYLAPEKNEGIVAVDCPITLKEGEYLVIVKSESESEAEYLDKDEDDHNTVENIELPNGSLNGRSEELKGSGGNFVCVTCDVAFAPDRNLIENHFRKFHMNHTCNFCDQKFVSKLMLSRHVLSHGDRIFKCDFCGSICKTKQDIMSHIARHLDKTRISEDEEEGQCDAKEEFYKKLSNCAYICQICEKPFYPRTRLVDHIVKRHKLMPKESVNFVKLGSERYQCNECKSEFSKLVQLYRHMKDHHIEICNKCHNIHQQSKCSKTDEYQCEICGKALKSSWSLDIHLKNHLNVKDYYCECGDGFNTKSALHRHLCRVHDFEPEYNCLFCEKKFVTRFELDIHSSRHTGDTPYECNYCKSRFRFRTSLMRHLEKHTRQL